MSARDRLLVKSLMEAPATIYAYLQEESRSHRAITCQAFVVWFTLRTQLRPTLARATAV
jgi:hypothetical protein